MNSELISECRCNLPHESTLVQCVGAVVGLSGVRSGDNWHVQRLRGAWGPGDCGGWLL